MASNSTVNYDNIVNSPLENGMLTVEEFVNDKAKPYAETSFINCQRIPYGDNLRIEGQLNRLMQIGDYIARVDIHVPKAGDQDAQKSISTGFSEFETSWSKFSFVIITAMIQCSFFIYS